MDNDCTTCMCQELCGAIGERAVFLAARLKNSCFACAACLPVKRAAAPVTQRQRTLVEMARGAKKTRVPAHSGVREWRRGALCGRLGDFRQGQLEKSCFEEGFNFFRRGW